MAWTDKARQAAAAKRRRKIALAGADWKAGPAEAMRSMQSALRGIGAKVKISADRRFAGSDTFAWNVRAGKRRSFVGADWKDTGAVFKGMQKALRGAVRMRADPRARGSDTFLYRLSKK